MYKYNNQQSEDFKNREFGNITQLPEKELEEREFLYQLNIGQFWDHHETEENEIEL